MVTGCFSFSPACGGKLLLDTEGVIFDRHLRECGMVIRGSQPKGTAVPAVPVEKRLGSVATFLRPNVETELSLSIQILYDKSEPQTETAGGEGFFSAADAG